MGSFLAYTLYTGVFLLLLYIVYRLFIGGEKQIALNRIILLGCYVVSFVAWPLSSIDWSHKESQLPVNSTIVAIGELPLKTVGIVEEDTIDIPHILLWIYFIGASVVLLKNLFSTASLFFYIRKGTFIRKEGYTLVIMPGNDTAPFSFGRHIVMSIFDYESVRRSVTSHELAHIRCRHYLDLLVAQAVCVVLWYNPASWLMRDELKLVHEYQADAAVIDSGTDSKEYQKLLIRKTVGNRFHTLANSLNHSKLKNRIAMMQKEESRGRRRLRLLSLALAVDLALAVVNIPAVASGLSQLEDSALIQENKEVAVGKKEKNIEDDAEAIHPAEFPGGTGKLMEYLAYNVRYPESAQKENRSGRSVVGYTVQKDGKISNIKVLKSSWPDLDEEAIRVVANMPDWTPAISNGISTQSEFALPVNFRLPSSSDSKDKDSQDEFVPFSENVIDELVVVSYGTVKNSGSVKKEHPEVQGKEDSLNFDKVQLVVGPCSEDDCDSSDHLQIFRVDGKVLSQRMTINADDIESLENIPPCDEFPNGLCDIKLKKK
ncbi:MAG: M56 family metallopeptidase [Muribaculaceae bacterium]|nr:M56 family metallopeptidase [Muribaculaceae bacterium]